MFLKKFFRYLIFLIIFELRLYRTLCDFCVISGAIKSYLENCIFRTDRKQSLNFEEIHAKEASEPSNIVVELNYNHSSTPYSLFIIRSQNFKVVFLIIVFFRVTTL